MIRIVDLPEALAIENNDYALLENEDDGQRKILASNISSSGGGGVVTYYLNNDLVAWTTGYAWTPLYLSLTAGWYVCSIKDGSTIRNQFFYYSGSGSVELSFNLSAGAGTFTVEQTRASMTYYKGSFRSIYCKLSSLILREGQIYT